MTLSAWAMMSCSSPVMRDRSGRRGELGLAVAVALGVHGAALQRGQVVAAGPRAVPGEPGDRENQDAHRDVARLGQPAAAQGGGPRGGGREHRPEERARDDGQHQPRGDREQRDQPGRGGGGGVQRDRHGQVGGRGAEHQPGRMHRRHGQRHGEHYHRVAAAQRQRAEHDQRGRQPDRKILMPGPDGAERCSDLRVAVQLGQRAPAQDQRQAAEQPGQARVAGERTAQQGGQVTGHLGISVDAVGRLGHLPRDRCHIRPRSHAGHDRRQTTGERVIGDSRQSPHPR
jgi:hypothetical protein